MPSFRNQRLVNHSAQDMFDLVADVETYPDFLPLCTGLRIRKRQQDQQGRDVLIADMSVGYKAIRETFTSKVTLDRSKKEILVEYVDGPFERLINRWTFSDESEPQEGKRTKSRVDFFIDYEFRNRMLGMLMGAMFDSAFRRFAEAFEQRADVMYRIKKNQNQIMS
ncbi:MAG: type II toxin-antitoxin system RatA family toxin [Alphaproteobacteria bacterium]|nr:type II toxin-antitoxin system RatA family toxin [Alphaproteobacteria bacterium]